MKLSYSSTLSLTLVAGGSRWLTPLPGCFTLGKDTCYLLYRRLGGPQGWSGWVWKISPTPGFQSPNHLTHNHKIVI